MGYDDFPFESELAISVRIINSLLKKLFMRLSIKILLYCFFNTLQVIPFLRTKYRIGAGGKL